MTPWYLRVMLLFAAGVFDLERHVRWSMAHEAGEAAHNERVTQVRMAHERRIEASLRPLPPIPPDTPLPPPPQ